MEITAQKFKDAVGIEPEHDDLERSNCKEKGKPGHYGCGWSYTFNKPFFMLSSRELAFENR